MAPTTPKHVAIVALGYSHHTYIDHVRKLGSRESFCDQVWAINTMGSIINCDLVFHMDDVRIQEIRAEARPDSAIARMLAWLKITKTPVMTSRAHPDYPALIEYPLWQVINKFRQTYFNGTVPYAVAYALHLGVEKISVFGCDYTYENRHKAEKGRACLEFWLGYAAKSGVEIALPENTTLMDSLDDKNDLEANLYGYDTMKMKLTEEESGIITIERTPRDSLPTADEIEAAYDHLKHPVEQGMRK